MLTVAMRATKKGKKVLNGALVTKIICHATGRVVEADDGDIVNTLMTIQSYKNERFLMRNDNEDGTFNGGVEVYVVLPRDNTTLTSNNLKFNVTSTSFGRAKRMNDDTSSPPTPPFDVEYDEDYFPTVPTYAFDPQSPREETLYSKYKKQIALGGWMKHWIKKITGVSSGTSSKGKEHVPSSSQQQAPPKQGRRRASVDGRARRESPTRVARVVTRSRSLHQQHHHQQQEEVPSDQPPPHHQTPPPP